MTQRALFESPISASPARLFDWHASPGAFRRLSPPWQAIRLDQPAPIEEGSIARLRLRKGPLWVRWTARHRDVVAGERFVDEQIKGPFPQWEHLHEFEPAKEGALLRDRIDYRLPGGALGRLLAGRSIARDLSTTFAYRHETTRRDLARHAANTEGATRTIAVSGASGLVGSAVVPFLTTGGHRVVRLTRGEASGSNEIAWSSAQGLDPRDAKRAEGLDAVVHLAGATIGRRWTASRKREIRSSRIDGTRNLVRSLAQLDRPPKSLICASAIGFYGERGETWLDEESSQGAGFLAEICRDWEAAAAEAKAAGIRVVQLRFGIVLSPAGGALGKMLPPFTLGLGGRIGSGDQMMSWVSIDDAIGAILHALLEDDLNGPLNVVAPSPTSNREFSAALARVLRRPALLPLPAYIARAAFGEMADEMLLASTRVRPSRLLESGFRFDDTDLERTLARLLGRIPFP